ncbi:Ubiquinone/menaquinone biosynthesis C-methylase UbiE [Aliiroseovarius halocynthiae]|uniref:Methyltransferase domain-containing protein n=1 Tax=Aliiroseovarius halocynthiae TaxID=985055 RepID=A0A545SNR7_9RHOB|nr:class I SAM-dependent methyltransferase [Aliiroseovarius halocynthiae]TQV66622.1 methyltransferase domain-containing protein [Aliiroseovarius halocynthiae]SMR82504.1 Ubiquinone/menaquinone biosynthesis C-methylase UbiE [Aliiroseovarius halocynthiae]
MQTATFWNKIADKYAKDPISDVASYEHKLKLTRDRFRPDMTVLEIACGTGSTAILHAPHVANYLAVDISDRMIEIAQAKDVPSNLTFQVANVEEMPLDPGSFDMVQAHSALHLLGDPKATIEKIYGTLNPGGLFVSSTACVGGVWWLKLIAPIGKALGKFPHLSWFTEDELRKMMRDAGFEIVEDWRPKGKIKALFLIVRKPEA